MSAQIEKPDCLICGDTQIVKGVACECTSSGGFCRLCCNGIRPGQSVVMRYGNHGRAVHFGCFMIEAKEEK